MNDGPSLSDEPEFALKPGRVRFTRLRWDAYFLPAVAGGLLIVAFTSWYSMKPGLAGLGYVAVFLMMWAAMRWDTPKSGRIVPTLSGIPGMIPKLWWLATWGLLLGFGGGTLLDHFVPMSDPLSAIIWAVFAIGWLVGGMAGGHRIERRYKKPSKPSDQLLE